MGFIFSNQLSSKTVKKLGELMEDDNENQLRDILEYKLQGYSVFTKDFRIDGVSKKDMHVILSFLDLVPPVADLDYTNDQMCHFMQTSALAKVKFKKDTVIKLMPVWHTFRNMYLTRKEEQKAAIAEAS